MSGAICANEGWAVPDITVHFAAHVFNIKMLSRAAFYLKKKCNKESLEKIKTQKCAAGHYLCYFYVASMLFFASIWPLRLTDGFTFLNWEHQNCPPGQSILTFWKTKRVSI